jgi:hypothetical protein
MQYFITSQNSIHRHQKSGKNLTCPKDSPFHVLLTPLIDFALLSHQDAFEKFFKTNYSLNPPRCIASLAEPVKFIQTLPKAREIFSAAGADVNEQTKVVTLPPYLVEDSIRSAPATFHAYGRIPESDVVLEENRVTFTNFGEGIMFVDPYTGEHRQTTKADTEMAARLIDYLDHVETYERCMLSHDKDPKVQALHNAEAALPPSTLPEHWCSKTPKIWQALF